VPNQPDAFLSYTRTDDEYLGGAITSLRKLLELGVELLPAEKTSASSKILMALSLASNGKNNLIRRLQTQSS
jgi:hypothetical protein